jgi:hypothetical protein
LGHTGVKDEARGAKKKHPLYNSWRYLIRYKSHTKVCDEWLEDFLKFIVDVGSRPSNSHKLYAADETLPIGPGNFVWKRSVTQKVQGEDQNTYRARWQRVFRKLQPEATKNIELKKKFGITREQYAAMHANQSGRCAICGKEESAVIRGKTVSLAVDHCHRTGKIRGLLCSSCNPGIGNFMDSIELLQSAIDYLRRNSDA